eukprot:11704901-Ditylum_brightwellii.AAC.1
MALKLKGIKMPQKRVRRSNRIVVRRDPGKTKCVWVVIQGSDATMIDLIQQLGKRDKFENHMQQRLKKYRKPFRELTM